MSVLERRLQILLDQDRYDLLAAESKRTGRSVAAVIREAIDRHLTTDDDARRAAAAGKFLELAEQSEASAVEPEPDIAELKAEFEDELTRKWEALGL